MSTTTAATFMPSAAVSTPTSSFTTRKQQPFWRLSVISAPQYSNFEFSPQPQLGLSKFSQWNGLKNLGISTSLHLVKIEKKSKRKGKGVYASLFGVGAPEALVIGVVALLVFGPKGLAEVARNLGKTLRGFQPTIRELQEVSREFKSTLEREIGLDDIPSSTQNTYSSNSVKTTSSPPVDASAGASQMEIDPNGSTSPSKAYSTEDYLRITEEQLTAASAGQQQSQSASPDKSQLDIQTPAESQYEIRTESQDKRQGAASVIPASGKPESET